MKTFIECKEISRSIYIRGLKIKVLKTLIGILIFFSTNAFPQSDEKVCSQFQPCQKQDQSLTVFQETLHPSIATLSPHLLYTFLAPVSTV